MFSVEPGRNVIMKLMFFVVDLVDFNGFGLGLEFGSCDWVRVDSACQGKFYNIMSDERKYIFHESVNFST